MFKSKQEIFSVQKQYLDPYIGKRKGLQEVGPAARKTKSKL